MLRPVLVLALTSASFAADIVLKPGNLPAVLAQARKAPKPVRIFVEDGVHPLTATITLGKDDSQVTWIGKNAVFMAGKAITGWQKAENGLWKAPLPDQAMRFEQLWINGRRKTHFTWDEWRKLGRDTGNLFAGPLFEKLAQRDFRLKPGSPAAKIGFKPWDLKLAGVRKNDAKWHALAAQGHNYPTWEADAQPCPAPPYLIDQDFEHAGLGTLGIRGAKYSRENKGESIGVTDETSSPLSPGSKRCLKVQDAPGLQHSYDPVLDIYPSTWDTSTFHIAFDVMAKPGADWFFEMRGKNGDFGHGPYLRWQNGQFVAGVDGKTVLATIPASEWFRVSLTATTGSGKWAFELTRQDGTKKAFL